MITEIISAPRIHGDCILDPLRWVVDQGNLVIEEKPSNCQESLCSVAKLVGMAGLMILTSPLLIASFLYALVAKPCVEEKFQVEVKKEFGEKGLSKAMRCWQEKAKELLRGEKTKKRKAVFKDSVKVNRLIAECLEDLKECHTSGNGVKLFSEAIIVKGGGKIQAIALGRIYQAGLPLNCKNPSDDRAVFHKPFYKVHLLASNPENIHSSSNGDARVEGAGASCVEAVKKRAKDEGCAGVFLVSVNSAQRFYQKLGFESHEKKKFHKDEIQLDGDVPMIFCYP